MEKFTVFTIRFYQVGCKDITHSGQCETSYYEHVENLMLSI